MRLKSIHLSRYFQYDYGKKWQIIFTWESLFEKEVLTYHQFGLFRAFAKVIYIYSKGYKKP